MRAKELAMSKKNGIMQSLDIALKGIKTVLIYNILREGVPKSNGAWEKTIQVVITSGVRDKIRQGMLFSNFVYRNKICFVGIPTKPFVVLLNHVKADYWNTEQQYS